MSQRISHSAGECIRRHRLARGLTLREFARKVGVSPATISAIENDKTGITLQRLGELAEALDVSTAELLVPPSSPQSAKSTGLELGKDNWRVFDPLPIDSVLAAAIKAFLATGYHGANMREVSKYAHMSVSGVYHHYASKQDLLATILDITMADLIWRMERARDEGESTVTRIRLIVEALALFHTRRPELGVIGASEMRSLEPGHYRRIASHRNTVQRMLDDEIREGIASGVVKNRYPGDAGKAIASMCTGLPNWFHTDGRKSPEQIAIEYSEFALKMLGIEVE